MIEQLNGHIEDAYEGFLTLKDAAAYVGLTYAGLIWNIQHNNVERRMIDGLWRIDVEALDAFKAKRVQGIRIDAPEVAVEEQPEHETPIEPTTMPIPQASPATNPEVDLLARVVTAAFARGTRTYGVHPVRLAALREVTQQVRVWFVTLQVGENETATYRVQWDGRETSVKLSVEE